MRRTLFFQIYGFASLGVVLLSALIFVLQTMPEFEEDEETGEAEYPGAVKGLKFLNHFTIIFFTVEYIVRLCCAPKKCKFLSQPMNIIDLVAIIPFYMTFALDFMENWHIIGKAGKLIRLVKMLRVLRIFKLVRHFAGLQALLYTLNQSYKELGLLMLLVFEAVLTFASLIYFAERNNDDESDKGAWSFLDCFWWGVMTITTVGYDDRSPTTFLGKIVGGCCALIGIFLLTLPIPIVVNSFAVYYKNRIWRNEVAYKRAEKLAAQELKVKQASAVIGITAKAVAEQQTLIDHENGEANNGDAISTPLGFKLEYIDKD